MAASGTLIQDIPTTETSLDHSPKQVLCNPALRAEPVHSIQLDSDSQLRQLLGSRKLAVNSIHHQGIDCVGAGLRSVGRAEDGIIEAVERPDAPWQRAVQFYPEDMLSQAPCQRLFDQLVLDPLQRRA